MINDFIKTNLLIEQHFHGCFGINFSNCSTDDVLMVSEKLIKRGIGGFFPTLVTDSLENIKRQIEIFKKAKTLQKKGTAEILGVHIEGVFLNPEKRGVHDISLFKKPTVENYKLIEDDFIKIVTLAPELDENNELTNYLTNKGIKVQAGHCVGNNLSKVDGVTHLFNGMGGVHHRNTQTALSALNNDDIYCEVIADGVHLSDDILKLTFKTKPEDKIILISDATPLAQGEKTTCKFAGVDIFYDGEKTTDSDGVIAGSSLLLDGIIKRLASVELLNLKYLENVSKYHKISLDGAIVWDNNFKIKAVEKDGIVIYKE